MAIERSVSINAVRDSEAAARLDAVRRLANAVASLVDDKKKGKIMTTLVDQLAGHTLEIVKDFYRRSGWLDAGVQRTYPIRRFAVDALTEWTASSKSVVLPVLLERVVSSVTLMDTMADRKRTPPEHAAARATLKARGLL